LEFGFLLNSPQVEPLQIAETYALTKSNLPGADMMASIVHNGWDGGATCYNALGAWIQAHHYQIIGPGREILLKSGWPDNINDSVLEIQFPIQQILSSSL
ncbi:MAG: MerR family transcriptional regulator, partial [Chloroflexi bacterium]|nr:MerR family transcriptional regulator [Chloroflexota bacterium]